MIWLKRFIFTIWLGKGVARFQGLFLKKKQILWKSSILKRFIFLLVSEYGNLTASRPTMIDLKIWGRKLLNRRFRFFDVGRDLRNPVRLQMLPGCWLFILLFALPLSLWKFSHFRSRLPFSGFHPRVVFLLFSLIVLSCNQKFKIRPEWVINLLRWFWMKIL